MFTCFAYGAQAAHDIAMERLYSSYSTQATHYITPIILGQNLGKTNVDRIQLKGLQEAIKKKRSHKCYIVCTDWLFVWDYTNSLHYYYWLFIRDPYRYSLISTIVFIARYVTGIAMALKSSYPFICNLAVATASKYLDVGVKKVMWAEMRNYYNFMWPI